MTGDRALVTPVGPAPSDWRAAGDSGKLVGTRHGLRVEAKERLLACLSSSSD